MIAIALSAIALAIGHIILTVIGTFALCALLDRHEPKPKSKQ